MAETATDSAPNGRKLDEEAKVEAPVTETAIAAPGTADKALVDLKASSINVVKEKVAADSPAESTIKAVVSTNASDEAVTKETSDHSKGEAEPMEEDGKPNSEVNSENKNAEHLQPDPEESTVSINTKPKEAKEAEVVTEVETKSEVNANNSSEQKVVVVEEEKVEEMDIDDKKQEKGEEKGDEKVEEKVEPKLEQQAGVVVNPKKKQGRPKKIRDSEGTKEEPKTPVTETKKRPRQKKDPVTPLSERDRPSRERKSIVRFVASVEKGKKELVIKQGTGTPLMDIPNVAFKLSKRAKGDDILNMLHSLLYNKRAKANVIKYNIFRFSGYVWTENEEKEKSKVREKLERCTKEGLVQLIDILDLHLNKTGKKEELVAKVLEFLESPHKTTEVSLEEREQKLKEKKRKGRTPGRGRGPGRKRRKLEESASTKKRGRKKKNDSDEDAEGDYANSADESLEEEEEVERKRLTFVDEHDDDDDDDDDEDYEAKQKPQKRPAKPVKDEEKEPVEEKVSNDEEEPEGDQTTKKSAAKSTASSSVKIPKASSPDITRSSSKPAEKVYTKGSRKKSKELKEKEKEAPVGKRMAKQKSVSKGKTPEKPTGRGRRGKAKEPPVKKKKNAVVPSDEVLQMEIRDLLKDLSPADFSKVTFMDIVVQLEEKFNVDLSVKKAHVKLLIRQEVSRLAEEVDEDDVDQEGTEPEEAAEIQAEPEAEGEAEPEAAAEGEATDTTEATGKVETPEAEQAADVVMEGDAAGDSEVGEAAKDVEAEVSEVRSKAEESPEAKTEDDQLQSTEVADTTEEAATTGD